MGSVSWALTDAALSISYSRAEDDGRRHGHVDRHSITTTEAGFGGLRQWLVCPCGRRCRVVYVQSYGTRCRRCYRLGYQSQRESVSTRSATMARKLITRVGGDDSWDYEEFPDKPKGMHWRTYQRLEQRHWDMVRRADVALGVRPKPLRLAQETRAPFRPYFRRPHPTS